MGRTLSGTMNTILGASRRTFNWTIDLNFPDASVMRFTTGPTSLTINSNTYTNDLESVSEVRQTIEEAVNTVSVGLQNKDLAIGQDVAANADNWRNCEAVIGRYYQDDAQSVAEWIEIYRGTVQQPIVDDQTKQVGFDIVPDTIARGLIVAAHSLVQLCGWKFKDANTCGFAGVGTVCDHHLKSTGGCTGYSNTHHFGGMETNYNPDSTIPGSGGDPTGGDSGDDPPINNCPRVDQWVLVKGADGRIAATMAGRLTSAHSLWHPILRRFVKVRKAEIVRGQPIWEIIAANGAVGYSSHIHPVLWFREHLGEAVKNLVAGDPVLTVIGEALCDSSAVISKDTGERSDVIRIEMDTDDEAEKIYCYGDSSLKLIACHNTKILI